MHEVQKMCLLSAYAMDEGWEPALCLGGIDKGLATDGTDEVVYKLEKAYGGGGSAVYV